MHDGIDPFASATEMMAALRARQISAAELVDLHLDRIARYNHQLNAIVTPNYKEARQAAAEIDAARARGDDRPLLGLPITIKDCIYTRGLPTTGGVPERAGAISDADAPTPARARAAGAVILGKTNVPTNAADWQSDNELFGRSNSPWDLERTPGGSTGGGAAAVAAGLSPLEYGGDLAGSIRIPSAFCGIYGHKTSENAASTRGHFPSPNAIRLIPSMSVQGPMARSAQDLELGLDVIAGPDVDREVAWRVELPPARHARLANYRVAVLPRIPWLPLDDEIAGALDGLAAKLRALGARVEIAQPEAFGDLRDYYSAYLSLLAVRSTVGRPREECLEEARLERLHGATFDSAAWADGLEASATDLIRWFAAREEYRADMRRFFRQWDVLLAPANLVNAFPHTRAPQSERWLDVNGQRVTRYGWQSVFPSLASFSRHPATAFPVGLSKAGLPIGLQALGPDLEDKTPIRFAALVADEFGGFRRPPGYV